ncbi:hypothetical protein VF04_12130 [Nostoc linckia z7]|uniref:Uncharacterized protein n=2 Tax=Nostoc linckia TaxID=92942 RepID=A0A9Q5ZDR3_NOSLI|nr:hypothetical protein VF02_09600 [Nostoc linckia z1]PHJ68983.1 hypothetical protein VF05_15235 [Nostoc linckia z3]PHJ74634.1 hypothetical protein VF03_14060 [Nostoc linckia z2]PHJ85481.1 hypothetical protein VF07_23090 [Nostoc linckia z6]PHJ87136.1 hypothetical protein VF06_02225 [Nostoc linckia z4]PHJ97462.1 hypothetical protein VF04_12130 [Nostoc linckia z7]PHK04628.1 hypothetical protein VF08_10370 [Nostoc linckia z8]PHK08730.1 hypothetical protein VF09_18525 [Nostoc linckia z9]PHK4550
MGHGALGMGHGDKGNKGEKGEKLLPYLPPYGFALASPKEKLKLHLPHFSPLLTPYGVHTSIASMGFNSSKGVVVD